MLQSFNWGPIPIFYIQYSLTLQMFFSHHHQCHILIVIITFVAMFRQKANCNFLQAILFLFFLVAGQADEATIDTGNASSHHHRPRYHRR